MSTGLAPSAARAEPLVDLHTHSTASDGAGEPGPIYQETELG